MVKTDGRQDTMCRAMVIKGQGYAAVQVQPGPKTVNVPHYSSLSCLQSIGLMLLLSTKVGRTYTNRIQLLCDPELLKRIESARFGG